MRKKLLTVLMTGLFVLGISGLANATVLTWDLDFEFSGADEPVGPTPWLQVAISDEASILASTSYDVAMTLTTLGLSSDEFVGSWYFNIDPALDANLINPALLGGSGLSTFPSFVANDDSLKADGVGGYFDFYFGFASNDFGMAESATFLLDYNGPDNPNTILTANSFNFGSIATNGYSFLTAAHVQGIGTDAEGSGWVAGGGEPVPEPATMLLFGTAIAGLAGSRLRKKNK